MAPLIAVLDRFVEIDGSTQAGLLSIKLFTVVIPLIIIGFAHSSGFARRANVGDLFIRDLALQPPLADRVRAAFGASSALASVWTFVGVAGFLVWGIPMASGVAAMFAGAWRRPQFGELEKFVRGVVWFALYLGTMSAHERIGWAGDHGAGLRVALLALALVPELAFWSLTPLLLVRDCRLGWRTLLFAGFAGVVIDGVALPVVVRLAFPILLEGWTGFGPMGVAMTLMTWSGVIATSWVVIACAGAVRSERHVASRAVCLQAEG